MRLLYEYLEMGGYVSYANQVQLRKRAKRLKDMSSLSYKLLGRSRLPDGCYTEIHQDKEGYISVVLSDKPNKSWTEAMETTWVLNMDEANEVIDEYVATAEKKVWAQRHMECL